MSTTKYFSKKATKRILMRIIDFHRDISQGKATDYSKNFNIEDKKLYENPWQRKVIKIQGGPISNSVFLRGG